MGWGQGMGMGVGLHRAGEKGHHIAVQGNNQGVSNSSVATDFNV